MRVWPLFYADESLGHGRTPPSIVEFDRGTDTMKEEFSKNVTIMTVVSDSIANKVIDNIFETMNDSDGRIFVYEVKDIIDIRTKKHQDSIL